jgi:cobalamin biosynthesis Mg chelatase CobN
VGSKSKRLRLGIVALACVVIAAAAAGRAAAQGAPKPERAPSPAAPVHPEAAPGARAAQKTQQKSFSSYSGSSTSTYTTPSTQTSRPAVTSPTTPARTHDRGGQTPVHRAAKKDPPGRIPTKPVESIAATGGEILVTSAHGLTKTPSSSESLLLLLVGLALVVLVVGETTFLRLAARGPEPQRAAEEPLPIHRVQLRR